MAAKILLVDSNIRVLTAISERLAFVGYEVSTASRVHDAVLKAIVVSPELLVCDAIMPELNGWELKRLVAHIPSLAETPILFLSSHDTLAPEFCDPASGLIDIAKKPLSADALAAAITAVLDRRAARQTLAAHTLRGSLPMTGASLVDLCHVLARRSASGLLRISAHGRSAEMVWMNGTLVDAVSDQLRGNEAVYAALAMASPDLGATMDAPPAVPPQRHVTRSLAELLSESIRRARSEGSAETSQPEASRSTETDEAFLTRLAATGLIRRTAAASR